MAPESLEVAPRILKNMCTAHIKMWSQIATLWQLCASAARSMWRLGVSKAIVRGKHVYRKYVVFL
jgi:hypothetical protein